MQEFFKQTKKKDFEIILANRFDEAPVTCRVYREYSAEKGREIPMTLYYYKGKHVGTYCQYGSTWMEAKK